MSDHTPTNLSAEAPVRVLLVDDHAMFRRGLRELLEAAGVVVVGEAHSARLGIDLARSLRPDVVVMDLSMPGMSGIQATRESVAADAECRVLILTASDAEQDLIDALIAGASGFLIKSADAGEIVAAIHAARSGDSSISPLVATRLVDRVRRQVARERLDVRDPGLTPREQEILRRISHGEDNRQIAADLYLSLSTVKGHVSAILDKLAVANRVQAAVWAARNERL